jgi:hypothetical protein
MSDTKQNMKEGRWAPDECPITGKPFFLWLSHPEFGYVPTYGGPFDSFMIAEPDEDGYYRAEHYCHDRGDWIEGGTPVTVRKELTVTAEIEIAPTQGADARPVAIYQMRSPIGAAVWLDVDKATYDYHSEPEADRRIVYATRDANPTVDERPALTDEQVEKGWRATFSTGNPYCPCNLTSFTKAVRWAERTIMGGAKS